MNGYLLLCVGAVYLIVAIEYAIESRYGMAVAWTAYAVANIGFAIDAWR